MIKRMKKPLSLLLILVLALSIDLIPKPAQAGVVSEYYAYVEIATPYEVLGNYYVELTKDDMSDDFGIGLSKDGTDDYSGARAFAKAMRRYVFEKMYLKDGEDFTEADVKKANALMPDFLKCSMTEYGLYIEGIASDGKTLNIGTAKDGKVDTDGAWTVLKDEKYSEVGLSSIKLSTDDTTRIEVYWASGVSDYANGWPTVGRFEGAYYILSDGRMYDGSAVESGDVKLVKDAYVYDVASGKTVVKTTPVSGASVAFYLEDEKTPSTIMTTDSEGLLNHESSELKGGYYRMEATEDALSADGSYTYSKITYTAGFLILIEKPGVPGKIKTSVSGKKAKKTVKLSWKNPSDYKDYSDCFRVSVSKSKNGKYKKACKDPCENKCKLKLKKGVYYVKVKCIRCQDCGDVEGLETICIDGDYTAPVKIKVK